MSTERRKLQHIYRQMIYRCSNPSSAAYKNYGGRGIAVCDRWLSAFEHFATDMGARPTGSLLDRIDNNSGYGPDNCRWSTRTEQNSNRRNCIIVDVGGEKVTLKEACRRKGLTYRAVVKRVRSRGWSMERALSEPIKASRRAA